LIPWQQGSVDVSPFTLIFPKAGIPGAASIMNFVVLTSTLSCANSGYMHQVEWFMLWLKKERQPKIFCKN